MGNGHAADVLAIDIGGTKLAAARVTADGDVVVRREVATLPTEAGRGEELYATLAGLLDEVVSGWSPAAVGVGCGGPLLLAQGWVSPLNVEAWRDFPLVARLRDRYDGVPVRLANDAVALALGEAWRGAGVGVQSLLGVVVSTGVGGGLVLDGRVIHGATGNAGHVGHVVVEPDGPVCGCGGRGCLEAIARGPAVLAWAADQGWVDPGGDGAAGARLAASAQAGDPVARAAFDRAGTALGIALASCAHLLELDVVAVGGGLAGAGELLLAPTRAAFARHAVMDFAARCRVVASPLARDGGVIGAAGLVTGPFAVPGGD